jgi:hypothetical protein
MSHDNSKTEAEAVNMRCPMRLSSGDFNQSQSLCLGASCMAWRWNLMPERECISVNNPLATCVRESGSAVPDDAGWEFVPYNDLEKVYEARWQVTDEALHARQSGYCGLAGAMIAGKGDS